MWQTNPGLIITRVTGYGQTGPYAPRAGFGSIGEAMGGIRYVTGNPDQPPARAGISLGDSLAATFACLGTLVAVHDRHRTGQGQVVDSAIYEAVLAMMESLLPEWALAGYQRERTGAVLPNVSPSNVYPTADDDLVLIAANQDTVFGRLTEVMGRPELADDERYSTHSARGATMAELDTLIAAWTTTLTADVLLDKLHAGGVPAGRIFRARDMFADPHFAARAGDRPGGAPGTGRIPHAECRAATVPHPRPGADRRTGARRTQRRDLAGPARPDGRRVRAVHCAKPGHLSNLEDP